MNSSVTFTRIFFFILSLFFFTVYTASLPEGRTFSNILIGLITGSIFGGVLLALDFSFRRFNIRSFNIATLGLFFGYLMGLALNLIFHTVLSISETVQLSPLIKEMIEIGLFLFGIYLGTLLTLRSSDELYVSIPFVKFTPTSQKKKDLLVESSILADSRIIDLAASGLLDKSLIIPRFLVKELYSQQEIGDEATKYKAKRSLDVLKKLETVSDLMLRYNDTDFPEVKDPISKMIRLARLLDTNILTADISRIQMSKVEGVKIINIHSLSNALKPLMEAGEHIKIKIQRLGKEPRQGVGYLDDGTMVVVNGGGNFIGELIDVQVLSVKHTSSGRMIFCNALDESLLLEGEHE